MRLLIIRSGAAAIVAAVALAACGGHGVVPQSVSQTSAFAPLSDVAQAVSPDKSPCNHPGMYYFLGSCAAFKLKMSGVTTVPLGSKTPYKGIKITTTFGSGNGPAFDNPPKGVSFVDAVMGDAIGKGDITGQVGGKSFPLYGAGKDCVNGNGQAVFCSGKPFVYAELINMSKYTLKPKLTPKFYITDANGFPGKKLCFPAILTAKTAHSAGGWAPNTTLGAPPKGNTLTINAVANPGNLVYPSGPFYVAGVCE
jgi:hypothetical protein